LALTKDWKGGDQGLVYIKRLGGLPQFSLYVTQGAGVSENALDDLQQAVPQVTVQHRGQACLGVSGLPDTEGCMIVAVQPDSAAEKAGLMSGDVIRKFADSPVKAFSDVVTLIGKQKAGDTVPVEFDRNGEILVKDVVLGEWGAPKAKRPGRRGVTRPNALEQKPR
jgi:S1-C subfamily serine protease